MKQTCTTVYCKLSHLSWQMWVKEHPVDHGGIYWEFIKCLRQIMLYCSGACLRQLLFVVLSLMRSNRTCFFFLSHIDISVFWEENFVLRSWCTFTRSCCLFPALFMLLCNYISQWCSFLLTCHSKSALYI